MRDQRHQRAGGLCVLPAGQHQRGVAVDQWPVVATNVLGANGSFTFIGTNVVVPNSLQQFYILSNTNH